jgi:hypothetical protein
MKKITMLVLLLGLSITFFSSCKKESRYEKTNSTETSGKYQLDAAEIAKIRTDLRAINSKYGNTIAAKTTAPDVNKVCKVVSADIGGAWVGFNVGSKIGVFFGGPGGAAFGAGFGMGICGIIASYGAAAIMRNPNGADVFGNIQANNVIYTLPNPYNNPFESAGTRHNELVKAISYNAPFSIPATRSQVFANVQLNAGETTVFDADSSTGYFMGEYNMFISNFPINTATYWANRSLQYPTNQYGGDDSLVYSVMMDFFAGIEVTFENQNNYNMNTTMSLINDYEGYFVNNQSISTLSKSCLLSCFAVAKHSTALWHLNELQ